MKSRLVWLTLTLAAILIFVLNISQFTYGIRTAKAEAEAVSGPEVRKDEKCESRIYLPWEEFKHLLKLDRDGINLTWEEFNRLLQQTDPEFKPEYDLIDGKILLSRQEFKNLLNNFKPLPYDDSSPVRDYLLTKSIYSGRMESEGFTFTADFTLIVLKEQAYVKIPLLSASLALKSMTVNGRPCLVIHEGGYYCPIIDKAGTYEVRAVFSVRCSPNNGPQRLQFPIKEAPVTMVDLELGTPDIEVEMSSAHYLETRPGKDKTVATAILSSCGYFDFQWKRKSAGLEKIPPMIYAEAYQLVSVEDDTLKIHQDICYNVLQSGVDSLRMAISEGVIILSVSGPGVGDWSEMKGENEQRILSIPLHYEQQGKFQITILAEKSFPEKTTMIEFSGLAVLDTVNGLGEKGHIGVEMKTGAELVLRESSGLEKVMVKNLPRQLVQKSANPLLLGFKYLKHPFQLVLDVRKHDKVALPQATIDSANGVSFFTEEGLIINKVEYAVKNQLKQSLRLKLPENAFIWSAMVGQESVEVMRDKDFFSIPLISSRQHQQELESFTVEVIYYTESPKFTFGGKRHIDLPQPDLTVSQILWSLYLPERFIYYKFTTNLEKEDLASGLTPILNRGEIKVSLPGKDSYGRDEQVLYSGKNKRRSATFRNLDISDSSMSQQVLTEFNFDKRLQQVEDKMIQGETQGYAGAGVLPMNIQIPTSGQLYRLAKNIVRDEQLEITVHYARDTILQAIIWLGLFIFLIILVLWRRRLQVIISFLMGQMKRPALRGYAAVRRFLNSPWSLPILGFLLLFFLAAGGRFDVTVCFLAFWTAAMIRLDRRIKNYKGKNEVKNLMIFFLIFIGLTAWLQVPSVFGQQGKLQEESHVSLEWSEFKESLGLDKDELQLTWEEFQAIVKQIPQRKRPVYTIQNGMVTLSRKQFDHLLGQMIRPVREVPAPLAHRLTRAAYSGKMSKSWTRFTADFDLEVIEKKGYKCIPFLPSSLALEEVMINDRPALLLSEGGSHQLILKDPGTYQIKAVFFMRSSMNETQYQISLPVQETSITLLEMEIPLEDIRVEVPEAQQVTASSSAGSTYISAIFPPVRNLAIQWYGRKKAAPLTPLTGVAAQARIYAQSFHLVSIDDDALKATMDIEYNILQAGVDELSLLIPEGLNILSVKGQGVGKWRERKEETRRILLISLDYAHKGPFQLTIEYEKTLLEAAGRLSFSTPQVLEAVKDAGYIGLELRSSAEVAVTGHDGLEKVAVPKLPQQLFQKTLKPLIYGFRYSQHPHTLELDIQRHPKISVTMAVIDSANAVNFFTPDGKVVHRVIYEVRNQLKQFLKIQLPEKAELWSVYVGGKAAEPTKEGDILYIPLLRSQEEGQRLKPFQVEVVYFQEGSPFAAYGRKSVFLPQVIEIIVSKVLWSLYLPRDFDFLHFYGNMEKEKLISGIRPIMSCSWSGSRRAHILSSVSKERADNLGRPLELADEKKPGIQEPKEEALSSSEREGTEFKKFKADRKDMMKQQAMERSFAPVPQAGSGLEPQKSRIQNSYDTAVMSIPISIPLSGQLYRFAKTAVRQEPLCIHLVYTQSWIMSIIGWLIFLVIMGMLFTFRKKLAGGLSRPFLRLSHSLENVLDQSKKIINQAYEATLTPLILIGLIIAAFFTHHPFLVFILFLVFLCVAIRQRAYWLEAIWKKKQRQIPPEKLPAEATSPEQETRPVSTKERDERKEKEE